MPRRSRGRLAAIGVDGADRDDAFGRRHHAACRRRCSARPRWWNPARRPASSPARGWCAARSAAPTSSPSTWAAPPPRQRSSRTASRADRRVRGRRRHQPVEQAGEGRRLSDQDALHRRLGDRRGRRQPGRPRPARPGHRSARRAPAPCPVRSATGAAARGRP